MIDAGVTTHFLAKRAVNSKRGQGRKRRLDIAGTEPPPYDDVTPVLPMLDTNAVGSQYANSVPFYYTGLAKPPTQQHKAAFRTCRSQNMYTDGDRPSTGFPVGVDLSTTESVDVKFSYGLYSVVSFADGSIYAVGYTDWSVTYYATSVAGVPTIQVPDGVKATGVFVRSNDNPWTAGGAANDALASPGYGWQPVP